MKNNGETAASKYENTAKLSILYFQVKCQDDIFIKKKI